MLLSPWKARHLRVSKPLVSLALLLVFGYVLLFGLCRSIVPTVLFERSFLSFNNPIILRSNFTSPILLCLSDALPNLSLRISCKHPLDLYHYLMLLLLMIVDNKQSFDHLFHVDNCFPTDFHFYHYVVYLNHNRVVVQLNYLR